MGVIAHLTVVAGPLAAQEKSKKATQRMPSSRSEGRGCKTKDGLSKTGEVMTDGWTTARPFALRRRSTPEG
jgi:hypothetical protein